MLPFESTDLQVWPMFLSMLGLTYTVKNIGLAYCRARGSERRTRSVSLPYVRELRLDKHGTVTPRTRRVVAVRRSLEL
jgi:hypothetical protein